MVQRRLQHAAMPMIVVPVRIDLARGRAFARSAEEGHLEELPLYLALLLVGLIPVSLPIVRGTSWGVEPTVGLFMILVAARGLLHHGVALAKNAFRR